MLIAQYYIERDIKIDTVLCLYETQALGAYIAHELSRPSMMQPNPVGDIYVLGPEYDAAGNMIFRDNLKRTIHGKKVLVLISCITSGKTVQRAIESVQYYEKHFRHRGQLYLYAGRPAELPGLRQTRLPPVQAGRAGKRHCQRSRLFHPAVKYRRSR